MNIENEPDRAEDKAPWAAPHLDRLNVDGTSSGPIPSNTEASSFSAPS